MKRLFLPLAAGTLAIGLMAAAPPTPAPQVPAPQATPTPQLQIPAAKAKATPTPAPPSDVDDKRVGISGVWEVQIQQPNGTVYTHFKLDQKGTALTGQYLDTNGKKYPLEGSVAQKDVHIVVTMPNGSAMVFDGTLDATTDMEGILASTKDMIGFTAAYRPKYKWIDNLSPNPGMGTQTGVP
ncbi:MAG TPA: hypothetical protein VFN37_05575 [Candidatus Baltobacteraceae bacterium]|nr:hypothetical protein [Candidatus Baltobacteraceae bacterium]